MIINNRQVVLFSVVGSVLILIILILTFMLVIKKKQNQIIEHWQQYILPEIKKYELSPTPFTKELKDFRAQVWTSIHNMAAQEITNKQNALKFYPPLAQNLYFYAKTTPSPLFYKLNLPPRKNYDQLLQKNVENKETDLVDNIKTSLFNVYNSNIILRALNVSHRLNKNFRKLKYDKNNTRLREAEIKASIATMNLLATGMFIHHIQKNEKKMCDKEKILMFKDIISYLEHNMEDKTNTAYRLKEEKINYQYISRLWDKRCPASTPSVKTKPPSSSQ